MFDAFEFGRLYRMRERCFCLFRLYARRRYDRRFTVLNRQRYSLAFVLMLERWVRLDERISVMVDSSRRGRVV